MKVKEKKISDELRPEYVFDYSKAVRGKYCKRILEEGANVVMLEPDVAKAFTDSASVNDALRSLVEISRRLYEGQTIDEIFARAKKQLKK